MIAQKLSVLGLAWILASTTVFAGDIADIQQFVCKPLRWYSGGFDFYQVKILKSNEGRPLFVGERYLQPTTPHGMPTGHATLLDEVVLTATLSEINVTLSGFENDAGVRDVLTLPRQWDGARVVVRSRLFENDIRDVLGSCERSFL